jgi:hypothetical protein
VDDFYRAIALGSAAFITLGAVLTVVTLQRERPFSRLSAITSSAGTILTLVLYAYFLDIELKAAASVGFLIGGAALGAAFGARMPLYLREGMVRSRAAGWHLALPAVAIASVQVMGVRESADGIILGFAAVHAATAFAVAACALVLVRSLGLRLAMPVALPESAATLAAAPGRCPACGRAPSSAARFCRNCGSRL